MADGRCTGWFNGVWIDCCLQHDCDCGNDWPLPCSYAHNYYLMRCVEASSYGRDVKYPKLVRINAKLMFVGVTVFNPILTTFNKFRQKL